MKQTIQEWKHHHRLRISPKKKKKKDVYYGARTHEQVISKREYNNIKCRGMEEQPLMLYMCMRSAIITQKSHKDKFIN